MAGPDVISVGSCGEAQRVLKRVEREASHRYQTLTLPEDGAANCLYVNGTLIHRSREEAPKSDAVRSQFRQPTLNFTNLTAQSANSPVVTIFTGENSIQFHQQKHAQLHHYSTSTLYALQ
jgi:hypothetical protein